MAARVKCPTCGKTVVWDGSSPHRPFCSERCKTTDFGAWAAERYRIAGDSRSDRADDWGESGDAPTDDSRPRD